MITITLAPCPGVDKPFAAVTKETVAFVGADVPDGLQVALFDGSGTCLAVADVQGAQATLDLDTQEAVDATAPVGPGEAVSVWLVVGDKDTHVATVPCKLIRNLIDDEATHPHVPAERYPTVAELNAWLEAAGEVREGVCTCAKAAASSAEAAASSARLASAQALDAVKAANGASASAKAASASAEQAASEGVAAAKSAQAAKDSESAAGQSAAQAASQASGAARSADEANASRQAAASSATAASQSAVQAGRALTDAQTARGDAQAARDAAKASETAAAESAKDASASAEQAQEAKAGAEAAKSDAEAAKQGAETAKAGAESAKASAEAKAQESATSATQAAQSATAAAGSATQAEEAKAEVQASAEAVGKNLFRNSILTVDGMDGASYFLRNDVLIAGDGRHYILCCQDKGKNTTRVQVFGPNDTIFGNAPLYDFTAKTLLNTDISNYCPGAAIHEGALYFWEGWQNTKKIDLATGELLANANSGHLVQGPGFINRKNGHVFRHPNVSSLDRFDADLVALDPLPLPDGEGSSIYTKAKVVYIHDVTYAQFSTGRFFWLDAEDVWHLVTDTDGEEVRSATYDGAYVAKTLAVWSARYIGEVEDATGAKKRQVQVSNLKQMWITTGYGADGEAIWAKNYTQNISFTGIQGSFCIHGANTGPCVVTSGYPAYLRDYRGGNTAVHIFNNADLQFAGNGDANGIVPPIITGGHSGSCTSLCVRQLLNWRFIP